VHVTTSAADVERLLEALTTITLCPDD